MKRFLLLSLMAVLGATCALAPGAHAQSMSADSSQQRTFMAPMNIESLDAGDRTAMLDYQSSAPNAPSDATSTTRMLLRVPLASSARAMMPDASGVMQEMGLRAASSALKSKRMTLRAEFAVAPDGLLLISRLVVSPVS